MEFELKPLLVEESRRIKLEARFKKFPKIRLNSRQISDLELLGNGGYTPLRGFLTQADYENVLERMRLRDGTPWSIPISLDVDEDIAKDLDSGSIVGLTDADSQGLAVLHVLEKFRYDKKREAQSVYGTIESEHPGVATLYAQKPIYLSGEVEVLRLPSHKSFQKYRLTPLQTRTFFKERRWNSIAGFQTRNPIHRAHEYLIKCALEITGALLLHPLVGETKRDDIPAHTRLLCYEELITHYFPQDRILLAVNPAAMRYAGPREAIFHAIVRRNYGCTHFIVGRDHAGVGNYYGTYDAHNIFSYYEPGELGIIPLFFEHSFYCQKCEGMASIRTCPHEPKAHVILSGTQVRQKLADGHELPSEFTRPEVSRILIKEAGVHS